MALIIGKAMVMAPSVTLITQARFKHQTRKKISVKVCCGSKLF